MFMQMYPYVFVMPDGRVFHAGLTTSTRILDMVTFDWSAPITTNPQAGGSHGSAVMYGSKVMKCG